MAEPIDDIAEAIGRYRYNFQSEAELEAGIGRASCRERVYGTV